MTYITLFFSTFLSEDLTCITAGILAATQAIDLPRAIIACTLGIYIGDFLLYLIGRLSGTLLSTFFRKFNLNVLKDSELSKSFTNHLGKSLILSRFLPGTRLPLYLYCGIKKTNPMLFLLYTGIAALLWTPLLVVLSFFYGEAFKSLFLKENLWLPVLIIILWLFLYLLKLLVNSETRNNLKRALLKWNKHEFWPSTLFYIPLGFYVFFLILRYRGFLWITSANPKIYAGGIAGESKFEILANSKHESILKTYLLDEEFYQKFSNREIDPTNLQITFEKLGISLPLILKPDIGERGIGVRLIKDWDSGATFLSQNKEKYLVQEFHPGPKEAGVFYIRLPKESKGFIFSITLKFFPIIYGDGVSTLKTLIRQHPRFYFQETMFFERWKDRLEMVLGEKEPFALGFGGNHIQGCEFRDGRDFITSALSEKIDQIAKSFPEFYFGRFDIRYEKDSDLMLGENLKILELNGAMSESTNLYDPDFSLIQSYSYLFRQWNYLFQVGYANAKNGNKPISWFELYSLLNSHSKYKENISPISQ